MIADHTLIGRLRALYGDDTAHCLNAGGMGRQDYETETLIASIQERAVSENPDNGPQGAGFRTDGQAYTLEARNKVQAVCFTAKDHGADASDISPTLRSGSHSGSHANGGVMPAIGYGVGVKTTGHQGDTVIGEGDVWPCLSRSSGNNGGGGGGLAHLSSAVRRLTPVECERLQGFPDNYTIVPYRGKPAADGPRYKALGNSMAVPVMAYIGQRIAAVEAMQAQRAAA